MFWFVEFVLNATCMMLSYPTQRSEPTTPTTPTNPKEPSNYTHYHSASTLPSLLSFRHYILPSLSLLYYAHLYFISESKSSWFSWSLCAKVGLGIISAQFCSCSHHFLVIFPAFFFFFSLVQVNLSLMCWSFCFRWLVLVMAPRTWRALLLMRKLVHLQRRRYFFGLYIVLALNVSVQVLLIFMCNLGIVFRFTYLPTSFFLFLPSRVN